MNFIGRLASDAFVKASFPTGPMVSQVVHGDCSEGCGIFSTFSVDDVNSILICDFKRGFDTTQCILPGFNC